CGSHRSALERSQWTRRKDCRRNAGQRGCTCKIKCATAPLRRGFLLRIPRATCRDQPTTQSHSFSLVQIGVGDAKQVLCLIRAWASRLKQTEHSELRVWLGEASSIASVDSHPRP